MEFLKFFAQRLNVSRSEAHRVLERALNNYRPARDYSIHFLDPHDSAREVGPMTRTKPGQAEA